MKVPELEAGYYLIYSEKNNDLIGFALISGEDLGNQTFAATFLTHRNTCEKKITIQDGCILLHNSLFLDPVVIRTEKASVFRNYIERDELTFHYTGFKHNTPRIAFLMKGRDDEEGRMVPL